MAALEEIIEPNTKFSIQRFSKSIIVAGRSIFYGRTPFSKDVDEIADLIAAAYKRGVEDTQKKLRESLGLGGFNE